VILIEEGPDADDWFWAPWAWKNPTSWDLL